MVEHAPLPESPPPPFVRGQLHGPDRHRGDVRHPRGHPGRPGRSLLPQQRRRGQGGGAWAYGFTLSIFIGGQLVDLLGMKRIACARS
jgi:hypothetical protein